MSALQSMSALFFSLFLKPGQPYLSGAELCDSHFKHLSHRVSVSAGLPTPQVTSLYTWTNSPFDPSKPSVVFIPGGPGDTAHDSRLELPGFNIIFFDFRGVACSKPETQALFFNPKFYRSRLIAEDIEAIRKFYKLDHVSLYAVSYGTVPAQIYAHIYPNRVTRLILEGVIFEGGSNLIQSNKIRVMLQQFFDSLPAKLQAQILKLSDDPRLSRYWFSAAARMIFYLDNGFMLFQDFLERTVWDESIYLDLYPNFLIPKTTSDSGRQFGHVFMSMIGCQELGMNQPNSSPHFHFENAKLVSSDSHTFKAQHCDWLQQHNIEITESLYRAENFKHSVSTVYIQGIRDGATPAHHAVSHFKFATKGSRTLVLVKNGGHAPVHGALSSGYTSGRELTARQELLQSLLITSYADPKNLTELSSLTQMDWIISYQKTITESR